MRMIISDTYLEHRKTAEWLSIPLLSAHPPPHYWATVDKGTPSRITNQAFNYLFFLLTLFTVGKKILAITQENS